MAEADLSRGGWEVRGWVRGGRAVGGDEGVGWRRRRAADGED